MTVHTKNFSFSPSLHHRHILANTDMPLSYDGGDIKVWRRSLRSRLRKSLGDMPEKRAPLDVRHLKILPHAGVQKAFRQLKRIYHAVGAADHCHLVVGKEGHRFYADDAWPVMLREIKISQRTRQRSD